ncbi:MAG: VCBS repeat-containing protein, partial [Myxococcales bacterium]|nr:VCBS repeat-containing protein [Myxococcales bacterium]
PTPGPVLGLVKTGESWRIARIVTAPNDAAWQAFVDEARTDVPAARAKEEEGLRAGIPDVTIAGWSPPALPHVSPVLDDLTGDGLPDLVYGSRRLDGGRAPYAFSTGYPADVVGDTDGDGRAELFVHPGPQAELWPGGDRASARALVDTTNPAARWAHGDLDGDGRVDLVSLDGSHARIWFDGATIAQATLEFPSPPQDVAVVGDLDGDGFADMAFDFPAYGHSRGAIRVVYGGPVPRSSAVLGRYGENLGLSGAAVDVDGDRRPELLADLRDGFADMARTAALALDGARQPLSGVARPRTWAGCAPALVGELDGVAGLEVLRVCGSELWSWSVASGSWSRGRVHEGYSAVPSLFPAEGGLALPLISASELRFARGPDWSVEPGPGVARVAAPAVGDAVPRRVHWSEVKAKTLIVVPRLPVGSDATTCIVEVTVDAYGHVAAVEPKACDDALFAVVEPAVLASSWYTKEPVVFEQRIVFK